SRPTRTAPVVKCCRLSWLIRNSAGTASSQLSFDRKRPTMVEGSFVRRTRLPQLRSIVRIGAGLQRKGSLMKELLVSFVLCLVTTLALAGSDDFGPVVCWNNDAHDNIALACNIKIKDDGGEGACAVSVFKNGAKRPTSYWVITGSLKKIG